jgi:hypothetical protein
MIEAGVYATIAICMVVSFAIPLGANHEKRWLKFVHFLIAVTIGVVLFPLLTGMWEGAQPQREPLIDATARALFFPEIGGVAYVGMWQVPEIIESRKSEAMPWLTGFCGAIGGWIGGMLATGQPLTSLSGAAGGFVGGFYGARRFRKPTASN